MARTLTDLIKFLRGNCVSHALIFSDTNSTDVDYWSLVSLADSKNIGVVMLVYTEERIEKFLQWKVNTQIGELHFRQQACNKYGPVYTAERTIVHIEGKRAKIGRIECEVFLGFRCKFDDSWHECRLHKQNNFHYIPISEVLSYGVSIDFYFRIEAYLVADYDPEMLGDGWYSTDSECFKKPLRWFEPGTRLHRLTLYDNPRGPYTNYHFQIMFQL